MRAAALFDGAVSTVLHYLPELRNPGWASSYSLRGLTPHRRYHLVHIRQLLALHALTGDVRFAEAAEVLQRDVTAPYTAHPGVEAAWMQVYREPTSHWDLYQLGEELADLEDAFRLWRFRHLTTVQRIIGIKQGTGGTSGVGYLRTMLDVVLFPEVWSMRTAL